MPLEAPGRRREARRQSKGEALRSAGRGRVIGYTMAGLLALAAPLVAPPRAPAWEWREEPVSFRISLALDRASTFTDVTARGGATTAYPYGSSNNPAADDFVREPPNVFTLAGSATANIAAFENGALLTGEAGSVSHRFPSVGTLTVIYSRNDSREGESRQGDKFTLRSNEVTLRYSRRMSPRLSVGGAVKVTESAFGLNDTFVDSDTLLDFPRRIVTDSIGIEVTLGALLELSPHWLVGASVGAGGTWADTQATVFIPDFGFGPATETVHQSDATRSTNVRLGVGWRPTKQLEVYADAQYFQLASRPLGSVDVGRLFVGVEFLPIQAIALRVGGSLDTQGAGSLSTGVGIYASKTVQGELAYAYNAFPEVRREFGKAHLISASIILAF